MAKNLPGLLAQSVPQTLPLLALETSKTTHAPMAGGHGGGASGEGGRDGGDGNGGAKGGDEGGGTSPDPEPRSPEPISSSRRALMTDPPRVAGTRVRRVTTAGGGGAGGGRVLWHMARHSSRACTGGVARAMSHHREVLAHKSVCWSASPRAAWLARRALFSH